MKRSLLILFGCSGLSWGQMQTSGGYTPTQLVQDFLICDWGIDLINVSSAGSPNAYGTFNGSDIGFNSGVIMTTGVISGPDGPVGPNNSPNAGMDNGTPGYILLDNMIVPHATFNATVISFTFIPNGDSIFLRYVFASEEFPEYVGSEFSDAFGVFLTGPDPAGGNYSIENIALIPGTNNPVTVSTMVPFYYVDNTFGNLVQYDGFSKPLIARAGVIPDSIYTITLAIADAGDGIYDSGVFFEEGSFCSGASIGIEETSVQTFSMFPNPAQDFLQIRSDMNSPIESIVVNDNLGRTVLNQTGSQFTGSIDVSGLPSGLYTVTLSTKTGRSTQKLIKL